jgi:hypothetical protein
MTTEEMEKDHALRKRLFAANQLVARLEKKLTAARHERTVLEKELNDLGTPILPGVDS